MEKVSCSSSAAHFTVFIDSNLETHLCMIISDADTVGDLKRKIEIEHPCCFPDIGKINIHALKVRRKSCVYHLPDSMLVKSAFDGNKGTRFLQMDAASACEMKNQFGSDEQLQTPHLLSMEPRGIKLQGGVARETESYIMNGDLTQENVLKPNGTKSFDHCEESELRDPHCTMLSVPNKSSIPQVGSCHLEYQQVPSHGQFDPSDKGRLSKVSNVGPKDSSDEITNVSDSEVHRKFDLVDEENEGLEAHIPLKCDAAIDQGGLAVDSAVDEIVGGKMENKSKVLEKAVESRDRKAKKRKKHRAASIEGSNPSLVEERDLTEDITPLGYESGNLGNENIAVLQTNETGKGDNTLSRSEGHEVITSNRSTSNSISLALEEGRMNSKDGIGTLKFPEGSRDKKRRKSKKNSLTSEKNQHCSGVENVNDARDVTPLMSDHQRVENAETLKSSNHGDEIKEMDNVFFQTEKTETSNRTNLNDQLLDLDQEADIGKEDKSCENESNSLKLVPNARTEEIADTRHAKGKRKHKKTRASTSNDPSELLMEESGVGFRGPTFDNEEGQSSQCIDEINKMDCVLLQTEMVETSKTANLNSELLCIDKEPNMVSESEANSLKLVPNTITEETAIVRDEKGKRKSKKIRASTARNPNVSSSDLGFDNDGTLKSIHRGDELKEVDKVFIQTEITETSKTTNLSDSLLIPNKDADKTNEIEVDHMTLSSRVALLIKSLKLNHDGGSVDLTPSSNEDKTIGDGKDLDIHQSNENKNEEYPMSKNMKKRRSEKIFLKNQLPGSMFEGEKGTTISAECTSQNHLSDSERSAQLLSDTLEHNVNERSPRENARDDNYLSPGNLDEANKVPNFETHKVDFRDYFVPKAGQREVVDPDEEIAAKEIQGKPHRKKNIKRAQKVDVHSQDNFPGLESSINSNDHHNLKKKLRDGSLDSFEPQGPLSKDENKHGHHSSEKTSIISRTTKVGDGFGTSTTEHAPVVQDPPIVSAHNYPVAFSASPEYVEDMIYIDKQGRKLSEPNRYHVAVRKVSSKKLGEVLNNSNQEKSLLAASESIFQDSSSESSQDDGVNGSEATTQSPDRSSTSAYSDGEQEERNLKTPSRRDRENMEPPGTGPAPSAKYGGKYREKGDLQKPVQRSRLT
ncbi:uncharacterized protein LOC143890009 isoform X2 [Tasmannia lanceolata]|uniref:uncharacterized protein LOC143890009 isoform X2 n=1 Tax=Tasmannia lanceolata TaxID=3420 RepID=UPI0040636205